MATTETEETDEDDDRVTILIKNPSREWDEPVEVYRDRDNAEERQEELGIDFETLTEVGRLVDAPIVDGE